MSSPDQLLLTIHDAASLLAVSPRTVARLVASGEIESIHIGRSLRIRPNALDRFIAARQRAQREKTAGF